MITKERGKREKIHLWTNLLRNALWKQLGISKGG
jgi:hypothetical protein